MKPRSARGRERVILERLDPLYAGMTTGLEFRNPFELLVATILSAQCTDERVNMVTPALFARFPTPCELADADPLVVQTMIHSCGFFRNKTKSILATAREVYHRFGGNVPRTMKELISLPGVARKTANVVLSHAFGVEQGIAVDTHVQRLARRLGLTSETDPVKIERDLMAMTPRRTWGRLSDVLIWHGRKVCFARSPACDRCVLADICPSAFSF
jgi:endonuclease III